MGGLVACCVVAKIEVGEWRERQSELGRRLGGGFGEISCDLGRPIGRPDADLQVPVARTARSVFTRRIFNRPHVSLWLLPREE